MKAKISRLSWAALVCLACCFCAARADTAALAQSWGLSWEAPTCNEDGSPLTDLLGYSVYVGSSPDTLVPYFLAASIRGMRFAFPPGDIHYFAIAAVNADGVESQMSAILSR